jgi:hypothetical protein
MKLDQQLIEARHLLRKHVVLSTQHGAAITYRCMECGRNGAGTSAEVMHLEGCRYAALMSGFGEQVLYVREGNVVIPPPGEVCDT